MDYETQTQDPNSVEFALKRSVMPKNKLVIIQDTDEGKQYCCVECPAIFMDLEKMEIHLSSHLKEFRFLCGICGTGLKRKEHLDRHTLGHQEVRPHMCKICGKRFKRKEHLNIHQAIHTGDKTEICKLCDRSFYRKDHLQKHLQTHNKAFMEQNMFLSVEDIKQEVMEDSDGKSNLNQMFDCEVTLEIDEENDAVQNDTPSFRRRDPDRPYSCPICPKTYKRRDHLKMHTLTHIKKEQKCLECGRDFHTEEQLLVHMNIHLQAYATKVPDEGGSSEMQTLIEKPDNTFGIKILPADPSNLLVPRANQKLNSESRPHACPICQRRFKRKQHLKVHANVHIKLQESVCLTIWCSLCNEGFQTNSQFESHQCTNQSNDGENDSQNRAMVIAKKENSYPAEIVQETKEDESNLALLEEQNIPTPQRVFVCKYCTKPFKRKDHYKIHLHIHTGIKSFFCIDCGKGFYRKDHLQKHSQVHQKRRPNLKKAMPDLFPINMLPKKEIKPEITITAPSNTKLRVPLQIKVPYQVVMSMDNGEQRSVTIDPQANEKMPDS